MCNASSDGTIRCLVTEMRLDPILQPRIQTKSIQWQRRGSSKHNPRLWANMFWDAKEIFPIDYLTQKVTISCYAQLIRLRAVIFERRRCLSTRVALTR